MDKKALAALAKRIKNCPEQIDNSRLYAGSPMYFYCRLCGHQSDVLPESYWGTPNKYCKLCKELRAANPGLTDTTIKEAAVE